MAEVRDETRNDFYVGNTVRSESRCALRLWYVDLVQLCSDARVYHFQHLS
jgi:hypothetical protein